MDPYVPSAVDQTWNPRPRRPWGKWIVIGVAAVLLVAGGIALWQLLSHRSGTDMKQTQQALKDSLVTCEGEQNPDACRVKMVTEAATSVKAPALCEELAGVGRDDCIWNVARESNDPSVCRSMADSTRAAICVDDVTLRLAVATHDATLCAKIADASFRTSCQEQIDPLTSANCASRGVDAATCDAMKKRDAAIAAGDLALCAGITVQEIQNSCVDRVGETDADADGLSALSEQDYGTSPTNPDTDGDGFKDGDEVAAGFNPNGSGKL